MLSDLGIFDNMKQSWFTGESSENRHLEKCVNIPLYNTFKA